LRQSSEPFKKLWHGGGVLPYGLSATGLNSYSWGIQAAPLPGLARIVPVRASYQLPRPMTASCGDRPFARTPTKLLMVVVGAIRFALSVTACTDSRRSGKVNLADGTVRLQCKSDRRHHEARHAHGPVGNVVVDVPDGQMFVEFARRHVFDDLLFHQLLDDLGPVVN
jgi:hypothetical protein